MPIINNPPKKKYTTPYLEVEPRPDVSYKMRVYRPGDTPIDRFYRSLEQLERQRQYYKGQGFKTRRI